MEKKKEIARNVFIIDAGLASGAGVCGGWGWCGVGGWCGGIPKAVGNIASLKKVGGKGEKSGRNTNASARE